jgi:lipid II:glycine glycyltransferase (peptidoglycan interpeptide bridge formation enzyme)
MMLYWNFLKYTVDHGFRKFDFGRSSPNEGTYKFKEQWGARATPLYWQYSTNGHGLPPDPASREKYAPLVSFWKKLPLPLANFIGPHIRKHISL